MPFFSPTFYFLFILFVSHWAFQFWRRGLQIAGEKEESRQERGGRRRERKAGATAPRLTDAFQEGQSSLSNRWLREKKMNWHIYSAYRKMSCNTVSYSSIRRNKAIVRESAGFFVHRYSVCSLRRGARMRRIDQRWRKSCCRGLTVTLLCCWMWGSGGDRMSSFVTFDEFLKCCVGFRLSTAGRMESGSGIWTQVPMRPKMVDKKG